MTLSVSQTMTAIAPRCQASFLGIGGTAPYSYYVDANGAGGAINETTGAYVAPGYFISDPRKNVDVISVIDATGAVAKTRILVGSPLLLFCDVIANGLCIPRERVYLWDQKILQPTDYELYVAVSVSSAKPFGNSNSCAVSGDTSSQFVSMLAMIDLDIISRGPSARDRKEEIILALNSNYSQQQQSANCFYISQLSNRFINLSEIDGAAIPYRYRISVNMQYIYQKQTPVPYYDSFNNASVITNE